MPSIFLLLTLLFFSYSHAKCASNCKLVVCGESPLNLPFVRFGKQMLIRPYRVPMGGLLCTRDAMLYTDVKIGEALVRPGSAPAGAPFVPISKYSPAGLSPRFRKRYFQAVPGMRAGVAFGRGRNLGNQAQYAHDLCVKIPLLSYKLNNVFGTLNSPKVTTTNPDDCFNILTTSHKLYVQVSYNGLADYDLAMVEPSPGSGRPGFDITPTNPNSPSGGVHKEKKKKLAPKPCLRPRSPSYRLHRRETILYGLDSNPLTGRYTVRMIRRDNCDFEATKFTLRALINDNTLIRKVQMNDLTKGANETVATFSFTVPSGSF